MDGGSSLSMHLRGMCRAICADQAFPRAAAAYRRKRHRSAVHRPPPPPTQDVVRRPVLCSLLVVHHVPLTVLNVVALLAPTAPWPAHTNYIALMDGTNLHPHLPDWVNAAESLSTGSRAIQDTFSNSRILAQNREDPQLPLPRQSRDAFYIILPLLIVLSTFLFLLLLFLLCVILLRRRRGISLRDHDGPVDMSREDLVGGEGGFDGVESRWLETVSELARRTYLRAKGMSAAPQRST